MNICENISILGLLAIQNIPQIFWISASIVLSHLIAVAEMVYHQLLCFSFPSTWSYPSCVWRIQKRKLPFYTSHSLTCWERKKKQQKDLKIVPSRNKHNKHSVEVDKGSIQTILLSIVATADIIWGEFKCLMMSIHASIVSQHQQLLDLEYLKVCPYYVILIFTLTAGEFD